MRCTTPPTSSTVSEVYIDSALLTLMNRPRLVVGIDRQTLLTASSVSARMMDALKSPRPTDISRQSERAVPAMLRHKISPHSDRWLKRGTSIRATKTEMTIVTRRAQLRPYPSAMVPDKKSAAVSLKVMATTIVSQKTSLVEARGSDFHCSDSPYGDDGWRNCRLGISTNRQSKIDAPSTSSGIAVTSVSLAGSSASCRRNRSAASATDANTGA